MAATILQCVANALIAGDKITFASGEKLIILPITDNVGGVQIGDGTTDMDVTVFMGASSDLVKFDVSAGRVTFDNAELRMGDADEIEFGDAADVKMAWDGTDFNFTFVADDSVVKFGDGTQSCDIWVYGNTSEVYTLWDASEDNMTHKGPARVDLNGLGRRYNLKWVAGQRGKPGLNADIQNSAEATRMVTDPDFEILGTNASSDDVTFNAEGGLTFTTDGADGDEVILLPHLDANQTAWTQVTWGTDKETEWECDITTSSDITNCIMWAGLKLTNTEVTATDDNQVFFRYENGVNSGKWQAIDSIGGTDTATDSGVTVVASTRTHLKITIDSSRIARFYLNGALVSTSGALTDATDLIPYIGVAADGAAEAKDLGVHGQSISRVIG